MNIYFVFEGKTEPVVYKNWLTKLLPNISEVDSYDSVQNCNYYYESDMGIPDCYNVVANAYQEINQNPVFDYLVLVIDADRLNVKEKEEEAFEKIKQRLSLDKFRFKQLPQECKLEVIVQKVCLETWFLGNRRFFVRNPESTLLKEYVNYYDVSINDPEELASEHHEIQDPTQLFGYSTVALFHESYLREIFKERLHGIPYRKGSPRIVDQLSYLEQLTIRIKESNDDLKSFRNFIEFCEKINNLK